MDDVAFLRRLRDMQPEGCGLGLPREDALQTRKSVFFRARCSGGPGEHLRPAPAGHRDL